MPQSKLALRAPLTNRRGSVYYYSEHRRAPLSGAKVSRLKLSSVTVRHVDLVSPSKITFSLRLHVLAGMCYANRMGETLPAETKGTEEIRRLPLIERSAYPHEAGYLRAHKSRMRQEIFLEAYSKSGSIPLAAERAGVKPSTHHQWMQKSVEYRLAFRLADVESVDIIEAKGNELAAGGNVPMIQFMLRHRRSEVYADKLQISGMNRDQVFPIIERLLARAGITGITPETLDAEFTVANGIPPGGPGSDQRGGDHLSGGSPSPSQKEKGPIAGGQVVTHTELGPIPQQVTPVPGTPAGPIPPPAESA